MGRRCLAIEADPSLAAESHGLTAAALKKLPASIVSGPAAAGAQIPNYLWQSIVVTLCCCLPLGIVSIIFAAQVNSKLAQGDIVGARDASQKAKMFALIGFGVGIVVIILSMIFNGAVFMQAIREAQANR